MVLNRIRICGFMDPLVSSAAMSAHAALPE
jgi:hypothetical protein